MSGGEIALEALLILLLGATLFHALRLERALGVLRRDRAALEDMVRGFNASTREAQSSVEHLRAAADGAGQQIARQMQSAQRIRDDLAFLSERSEQQAERLERAVRQARMLDDVPGPVALAPVDEPKRLRSQAERDLLQALQLGRA